MDNAGEKSLPLVENSLYQVMSLRSVPETTPQGSLTPEQQQLADLNVTNTTQAMMIVRWPHATSEQIRYYQGRHEQSIPPFGHPLYHSFHVTKELNLRWVFWPIPMHQHHPTLHPMFCFKCLAGVVQHRDIVWRGYRLRTGQTLEIPVITTHSVPPQHG